MRTISPMSIVVIYYIIDTWFHLNRHQTRLTTYLNFAKTIVLFIHYKSVTFSLSFQFNCLETENYIQQAKGKYDPYVLYRKINTMTVDS
jgi:hypothetical protein